MNTERDIRDLKSAVRRAIDSSDLNQAGVCEHTGYSKQRLSQFLSVKDDKDMEAMNLVRILACIGHDLVGWLDNETRPPSRELEAYLTVISRLQVPSHWIEILLLFDRLGAFRRNKIEEISVKLTTILDTAGLPSDISVGPSTTRKNPNDTADRCAHLTRPIPLRTPRRNRDRRTD